MLTLKGHVLQGKIIDKYKDIVELENGEFLDGMKDGRYFDKDENEWQEVIVYYYNTDTADVVGYERKSNHKQLTEQKIELKETIQELKNNSEISKEDKSKLLRKANKQLKQIQNQIIEIETHLEWYQW